MIRNILIYPALTALAAFAVPAMADDGTTRQPDSYAKGIRALKEESSAIPEAGPSREKLPFRLSVNKSALAAGEKLVITVRSPGAAHVRLLYQNAGGEIVTLFPNKFHRDDTLAADHDLLVPSPAEDYSLMVSAPFGVEHIAAIASEKPFVDATAVSAALATHDFIPAATGDMAKEVRKCLDAIPSAAGGSAAPAGLATVTIETLPVALESLADATLGDRELDGLKTAPRVVPASGVQPKGVTGATAEASRFYGKGVLIITRRDGSKEALPYVPVPILFVQSRDQLLNATSEENVKKLGEFLRKQTSGKFVIEAHTSAEGPEEPNIVLSKRRAAKIHDLLTRIHNVPATLLEQKGHGEQFAAAKDDAPVDERQKDRRVLVVRKS